MKKILFLLTLTLLIFIFSFNSANAAIRVSPTYIELDANKTKKDYVSGSFTVSGGKDETVRFKVYPVFFERDNKGNFIELEDRGQKKSLVEKIKFYPSEFTCKNGIEQKVRFTITGIKSLPNGDSRLVLFLEDVNTKEIVIKNAAGGAGGKIILKTRVGISIYVDKGLYSKKGTLDSVVFKKDGDDYMCNYKLTSTGNSRIRYNGLCYISQNGQLINKLEVTGATVEAGNSLEKTQKLDIPKGILKDGQDYKMKFVLTYKDENEHEKTLRKELIYTHEKTIQSKI